MIISPPAVSGYATFCDDIREEVGGKTTLVGIYGPVMQVAAPSFPTILPQLCCLIELIVVPTIDIGGARVELRRFSEDSEYTVLAEFEIPAISGASPPSKVPGYGMQGIRRLFSTALRISPLSVEKDFTLHAVLLFGGDEYRLGNVTVMRLSQEEPSA